MSGPSTLANDFHAQRRGPCGYPTPARGARYLAGWQLHRCLQETREVPGSTSQVRLSHSLPMNTTRLSLRGTPARGLRLGALFGLCALALVFTLALTASTSGTSGAATLRTAAKQSAKHKPSSAKSFSAFQKCLSKHGLKLPARGARAAVRRRRILSVARRRVLVAPAASAAIRKPKPHSSNAPACSQREGSREDREEPVDPPARRSPPIATA